MKYVFLDFEYNSSSEKVLNLVCVSYEVVQNNTVLETVDKWLYNHSYNKAEARHRFNEFIDARFIFVGYGTAEARALDSLGVDITKLIYIDLLCEVKQIKNHCGKWTYGDYLDPRTGEAKKSIPPWINPRKDNTKTYSNLASTCWQFLKVNIDTEHKTFMRDVIIENDPDRIRDYRVSILDYCRSDIKYMSQLYAKLNVELIQQLKVTPETLDEYQLARGRWSCDIAKMEAEGIPIDVEAIKSLSANYEQVVNDLISACVEVFPFWVKMKKTKKGRAVWVKKADKFAEFVESKGRAKTWATTGTGNYASDRDVLKVEAMRYPEIKILKTTSDTIQQLKWFRPEALDEFLENVGSDGRLRPYFNTYGTQSGRNAPPARSFIFAMSSWLRSVVRPPEGKTVVSIDYGSQEFVLAGVLSGDNSMMDAYASGDPYLYFGKKAGAIPEDGTKKTHAEERKEFKAVTLGLQYGMRGKALAGNLTLVKGREVTEAEANKLIDMHRRVYPKYWKWLEKIERDYRKGALVTPDGWAMFKDNKSKLSMLNFPVQGGAQSILRRASTLAHEQGLKLCSPLHDALYMVSDDADVEEDTKKLSKAMLDAVIHYVGACGMRIDIETHDYNAVWIEEKGEVMYKLLGKYLGGRHSGKL